MIASNRLRTRSALIATLLAGSAMPALADDDLRAKDARNKFQIGEFNIALGGEANLSLDVIDTGDDSINAAIFNNFSEVVIGVSTEIAPNVELFAEFNTHVALDGDEGGDGFFGQRDSFVGITGPRGTVTVGVFDTPYEDSDDELEDDNDGRSALEVQPLSDGISDWKAIMHALPGAGGSDDVFDVRAINAVEYASPRVNGFNFRTLISTNGSVESTVNDAEQDGALFENGLDNNDFWLLSASASYAAGPIGFVVAYERQNYDDQTFGRSFSTGPTATFGSPEALTVYAVYGAQTGTNFRLAWEYIDMDDSLGLYERPSAVFASVEQILGDGDTAVFTNVAWADSLEGIEDSGATFVAAGIRNDVTDFIQIYAEAAATLNEDYGSYSFDRHAGVSAVGEDVIGASVGFKLGF